MNREYNIKEKGFRAVYKGVPPFMRYENGYGYLGVLLEHEETGKLQCHLCGTLANNLSKHLYHAHKDIKPTEYRQKVGLNLHTPLMSESTRKKIRNNFLNLTEEKKDEIVARLRDMNKSNHRDKKIKPRKDKGGSSEMQNKFGTCPEQAKARFWEEYNKFGRIPSNSEISAGLRHLVYTRFKSYKDALLAWGISERQYREYVTNNNIKVYEARRDLNFCPKFTEDEVKQQYSDFFFEHKRMPTWSEVQTRGMAGRCPFERVFGMPKSEIEKQFNINKNKIKICIS